MGQRDGKTVLGKTTSEAAPQIDEIETINVRLLTQRLEYLSHGLNSKDLGNKANMLFQQTETIQQMRTF